MTTPRFSLHSGSLPPGLSLNLTTGRITGIPTTIGTWPLTVRVLGSTQSLSLEVVAGLTITTASLPAGAKNSAYSQTLAATGGLAPFTWALASGALPAGLTLNEATGAIAGTPTVSGTFPVVVRVTDSMPTPQTTTQALTLTLTPDYSTIVWSEAATPPTQGAYGYRQPLGYHAARDVVLFVDQSNGATWTYAPGTDAWANLGDTTPGVSSDRRVVYDSVRGKLYAYSNMLNQKNLWAWDGGWTSLGTGGPNNPAACCMAYDAGAQRMIVWNPNTSETWEYNGAAGAWAGPYTGAVLSSHYHAAMAYMPSLGKCVLYGGTNLAVTRFNDTYAYDQATHSWALLAPVASPSTGRVDVGCCYDSARGGMVIAGGSWVGTGYTNQVWFFNGTTWAQLSNNLPASLVSPGLVCDTTRGRLILSHGADGGGAWVHTYQGDGVV